MQQHETVATIAAWCEQNWPRYAEVELAQHAAAAVANLQQRVEERGAEIRPGPGEVEASIGDVLITIAHIAFRRGVPLPPTLGDAVRGHGAFPQTINLSTCLGHVRRHLTALERCLGQGGLLEPQVVRTAWGQLLAVLEYLEADAQAVLDQAMIRRRVAHGLAQPMPADIVATVMLLAAARPLLDEARRQVDAWAGNRRGPGRTQRGIRCTFTTTAGALFDVADALARHDQAQAGTSPTIEAPR